MKLLILYGPPAVGKMTIGQALEKITGLKLFHNHMSLEFANQLFGFDSPYFEPLSDSIRTLVFETVAKSELPGLIFTYVWAFDEKLD